MVDPAQIGVARVPAGAALFWLRDGARRVWSNPLGWSGLGATSLLLLMLSGLIPQVGGMVGALLSPFLMAGFMVAGASEPRGAPVSLILVFSGFRERARPLAILGILYLLVNLLVEYWIHARTGIGMAEIMQWSQVPDAKAPAVQAQIEAVLPILLMALVLMLPVFMANWFAPALVMLDDFPPLRALWWSLWACGVNPAATLLFISLLSGLWIVALFIPFGIGMLLFFPLGMSAIYSSYLSIFHADIPTQTP